MSTMTGKFVTTDRMSMTAPREVTNEVVILITFQSCDYCSLVHYYSYRPNIHSSHVTTAH